MMRPHPRSYIAGRQWRINGNGAVTINCWRNTNRSGGNSSMGAMCCTPALLTRMSTSRGSDSMAAGSVRSATCATAPYASAASLAEARSTSTRCTLAPASRKAATQARPIPFAPPVTRAVLPVSELVDIRADRKADRPFQPCAHTPQPHRRMCAVSTSLKWRNHGRVRISAPVSVTRIVCSNWAVHFLSLVVTVQPSSQTS